MPYFPHTPEALLIRSDSKNPHSTCNGLTSNGRSCRRAISQSPSSSPLRGASPEKYCWQHREQDVGEITPNLVPQKAKDNKLGQLKERGSVDTLVDRLGLLEVDGRKKRKDELGDDPVKIRHEERSRARSRSNTGSNLALFCCIGSVDDVSSARPSAPNRRKKQAATHPISTPPRSKVPITKSSSTPQTPTRNAKRPSLSLHSPSHTLTSHLLSLIPPTTPPQTASLLLAELSKPPSQSDAPGYIYIFWLTASSTTTPPPTETAPSLLLTPQIRPTPGHRRTSEAINTFAISPQPSSQTNAKPVKTILLKIGRAQNVHRRLNQWTRQCGYDLSLVRYYPYQPSTPPLSVKSPRLQLRAQATESEARKVPFASKIERLIHIELAEKKARDRGTCDACGREHREWFEVEASRDGVREVDEVVKRWVEWGEVLAAGS